METTFKCKLASRGWHVYGRTVWSNPKEGEIIYAEQEKNKTALMHDPYSVAWKSKSKGKLIAEVVGHVPREISRAVTFFLQRGGRLIAKVSDSKYRRSPIAKGGLEIPLLASFIITEEKKRYLDRMKCIVEVNYDESFLSEESCDRNDLNIVALCGEDFEQEGEEDFLIDDTIDELIVID